MSFINEQTKEINCKILYFGPPLCGKSTTLRTICHQVQGNKTEPISIGNGEDRTLFFDFVPLTVGKIRDFTIRLHLYTVPGQAAYTANRKIIAKGVDGIVFIVDSQVQKMEENLTSLKELRAICESEGHTWGSIPMVIQYNKRDLPQAAPLPALRDALNPLKAPDFETVATTGTGVMDALKAVGLLVLRSLKEPR
ncbi:MAG: GTPase domain-containing protein [Deltaproteobacteria bacterium]|nr:GTPase domain-containing protein [Deltaproteobacteria bacterium]